MVKGEGVKREERKRAAGGKPQKGKCKKDTERKYLCLIFLRAKEIFLVKNFKGWNRRKEVNF